MSEAVEQAERVAGGEPMGHAFAADMASLRARIDARLDALLPAGGEPSLAARHSLLAPGKRLRAVLTVLAARQCGGDAFRDEAALDVACAVEMVHTASLVFDDLPAMDDADTRRGAPTPHTLYGDDVAILAGIGLLNGAFGVVAGAQALGASQRVEVVDILSRAVGWTGLVQGQADDLRGDAGLDDIHYGKTGALFVAAALAGAACAQAPVSARPPLVAYGRALGFAYQALDDVVDQVASVEAAGKTVGRDEGKRTATLGGAGLEEARARAGAHLKAAKRAAGEACSGTPLTLLAAHIEEHFARLTTA